MRAKPGFIEDSWLASVMGHAAFRLDEDHVDNALLAELKNLRGIFCYLKLDPGNIRLGKKLEAAGFSLVDTNLQFQKLVKETPASPPENKIHVFTCRPDELDPSKNQILDIAAAGFTSTRFHLDPKIDPAVANKIKREWVANFFAAKRGDSLIAAADASGRIVGFLLEIRKAGQSIIDLIAVAPEFRSGGVGRAMVGHLEAGLRSGSVITVGTQLANKSSLGFYQKMGFRLLDGKYVFHFHG